MSSLQMIFHSDPGHAWLEVPKDLLKELDIEQSITSCSYMDSHNAYLEEDLDAGVFIDAAKANGYSIEITESFKEITPIRNLPAYRSK